MAVAGAPESLAEQYEVEADVPISYDVASRIAASPGIECLKQPDFANAAPRAVKPLHLPLLTPEQMQQKMANRTTRLLCVTAVRFGVARRSCNWCFVLHLRQQRQDQLFLDVTASAFGKVMNIPHNHLMARTKKKGKR